MGQEWDSFHVGGPNTVYIYRKIFVKEKKFKDVSLLKNTSDQNHLQFSDNDWTITIILWPYFFQKVESCFFPPKIQSQHFKLNVKEQYEIKKSEKTIHSLPKFKILLWIGLSKKKKETSAHRILNGNLNYNLVAIDSVKYSTKSHGLENNEIMANWPSLEKPSIQC